MAIIDLDWTSDDGTGMVFSVAEYPTVFDSGILAVGVVTPRANGLSVRTLSDIGSVHGATPGQVGLEGL